MGMGRVGYDRVGIGVGPVLGVGFLCPFLQKNIQVCDV